MFKTTALLVLVSLLAPIHCTPISTEESSIYKTQLKNLVLKLKNDNFTISADVNGAFSNMVTKGTIRLHKYRDLNSVRYALHSNFTLNNAEMNLDFVTSDAKIMFWANLSGNSFYWKEVETLVGDQIYEQILQWIDTITISYPETTKRLADLMRQTLLSTSSPQNHILNEQLVQLNVLRDTLRIKMAPNANPNVLPDIKSINFYESMVSEVRFENIRFDFVQTLTPEMFAIPDQCINAPVAKLTLQQAFFIS